MQYPDIMQPSSHLSGGHHIFTVPDQQLVIITTGHWDNARSTREIMQACVDKIIKAL